MTANQNRFIQKYKEQIFLSVLLICGFFLYLTNLDNSYLWQDEAQTALISRTVLTHGLPFGTDGKNFFSQGLGAEYGNGYLWKWHTWFQFYVTAASFKLLGINTFSARLPFALFGLAMIPLLYYFTLELSRNKRIAGITSLLFTFCIPYIIMSRQCRYYSPVGFFSILGLLAYLRVLQNKKLAKTMFVTALVLLFNTHFIYLFTELAAVLLHSLIYHRRSFKKVFILSILSILICLPWIIWLMSMKYEANAENRYFSPKDFAWNVTVFLWVLGRYILPFYIIVPALIFYIYKFLKTRFSLFKGETQSALALIILFMTFNIILLAGTIQGPFPRYIVHLFPAILVFGGYLVNETYSFFRRYTGVIVLIGILAIQPFYNYFYELTHSFSGPIGGIVRYLDTKAKPQDIVAITYGDLPLKFYTQCRVVGGLTGEDLSITRNAKWVIIRKNIIGTADSAVKDYFLRNIDFSKYERIDLDSPDTPFENRETPREHYYRTVLNSPKVTIFKRIKN